MQVFDSEVTRRLLQIGNVCVQYSYLDYLISMTVWHLLKLDKQAGILVTGPMDIRPKVELAISLTEHFDRYPDIRKLLKSIKNNASKENGFIAKRNLIVHGITFTKPDGSEALIEGHRKKSTRSARPLRNEFIQSVGNEIGAVAGNLRELLQSNEITVD